jgi:4-hydroxythreonine-4-phosphate dehydrogenase
MGEPAGIGGEITLKAWRDARAQLPAFVAIDDPARLEALAKALGWTVPVRAIAAPADAAAVFPGALPVLPQPLAKKVAPGKPDAANAKAVLAAVDRAGALCRSGEAAAMVTNPIHKATLYAAGFKHDGHTEYLGAMFAKEGARPVMMLVVERLRVVPVTIHMALKDVPKRLTTEAIVAAGEITARALQTDFGIAKPRLAVAALNPHSGEGGAMGGEEAAIIAPAIAQLRAAGIEAFGPAPADTLFHARARAKYDAALCMYHDQALIPLKTIDFDRGVNVTLGLPIVRTSPDHGTAFDLAGTGTANADSLIAAIALAGDMAKRRAAARAKRAVA